VPDCMAPVIAGFTPTTAAAAGFSYQIPGSTPVEDALFPQWLCNVNLPSGLVTMGCATGASAASAGPRPLTASPGALSAPPPASIDKGRPGD
jgi:hypothetical protein